MMIKLISAFHRLDNVHAKPITLECMFLQEKIQSAKPVSHFADQLKNAVKTNQISKIEALARFSHCHKEVEYFNNKIHSIGYIHGDISTTNILYNYGIKISIDLKVSVSKVTFEKTYKYQLVDPKPNEILEPKCYIIDFESSKSKDILTSYEFVEQALTIQQDLILQTFLFAHPFLYKFIAYPQGRSIFKDDLVNRKDQLNLKTKVKIDDVIWMSAILCENYAVAASFLSTLEQTGTFDQVFSNTKYGSQLDRMSTEFFAHVPKFGSQQQISLIAQLQLTRQLNEQVIGALFETIQHNEYVHEKSIVETMIMSMNNIIHWNPTDCDFLLNRILHVHQENVNRDVVSTVH